MTRFLFLICVLAGAIFAEEPPKTMTKIEVILQSPDAPAGSFAAKPRVFYRAGNPRADVVGGAIEACRLEAREPAGVRLGGGGDAV